MYATNNEHKNTTWEFSEWLLDIIEQHEDFDGETIVCLGSEAFIVKSNDTGEAFRVSISKEKI